MKHFDIQALSELLNLLYNKNSGCQVFFFVCDKQLHLDLFMHPYAFVSLFSIE